MFLICRFSHRLHNWFSRLNGFKSVILGTCIDCCSVWAKTSCWSPCFADNNSLNTNCDLDGKLCYCHSYHIVLYFWKYKFTNNYLNPAEYVVRNVFCGKCFHKRRCKREKKILAQTLTLLNTQIEEEHFIIFRVFVFFFLFS